MNTEEATREELKQRVEELEALVEIKSNDDERTTLEDIWIAGIPIGTIIDGNRSRIESVQDDLSAVANDGVSSSGHENRDALMPLHSMWIDLRDGADDRISNASVRRAAILFHEILRQATDGSRASVAVTRERYLMSAPDAKQPILEHDETVDQVSSQQVKRAFAQAQMLSGRDCDCDDVERCEHGLLVARFDGATNKLTAHREDVLDYLRELDEGAADDGTSDTDDPVEPGEDAVDTDDIESKMDAITSAQSNAGVSSSDAPALDHEAAPDGGTQPR